jgi:two-component system CheB/CheR fusion protein
MPAQLIAFASQVFGKRSHLIQNAEGSMKKIFNLLRSKTGHDFSHYKPSTINRRIERRMANHNFKSVEDYVLYLQKKPEDVDALFHDLLIGVTSFFRNPTAFEALQQKVIHISLPTSTQTQ